MAQGNINLLGMTSEKSKELTCPKCGVVLNDKNYFEHTVYHNCIMGVMYNIINVILIGSKLLDKGTLGSRMKSK